MWRRLKWQIFHPSRRGKGFEFLASCCIGILLACSCIHWINQSLRPQMLALAEAQISSQITRIAGRSVQRALLSHRGQQLTQREQFDGEGPTILMIDPVLLNDLRFSVVDAVNEAVTAMKQEDLDIPLGSVTGLELLSGLGPGVPVHILSVASVTAEYHSEFQEAGINQTLHRMLLDVVVRIKLLLPGCRTELSVGVPICISETVIVGNTPYYQNLYR